VIVAGWKAYFKVTAGGQAADCFAIDKDGGAYKSPYIDSISVKVERCLVWACLCRGMEERSVLQRGTAHTACQESETCDQASLDNSKVLHNRDIPWEMVLYLGIG